MGYKYREVICPLCKRKFMWEDKALNGSINEYFKNRSTGEIAGCAICTTCNTELAVLSGVIEGVLPAEKPELEYIRELGI